jgi:hypothetical protein
MGNTRRDLRVSFLPSSSVYIFRLCSGDLGRASAKRPWPIIKAQDHPSIYPTEVSDGMHDQPRSTSTSTQPLSQYPTLKANSTVSMHTAKLFFGEKTRARVCADASMALTF